MRFLVLSDSHGNVLALKRAIEAQPDARHIFFLGDCVRDIESIRELYPDRIFHTVQGNCDYNDDNLSVDIANISGVKILFTHGHRYFVKGSLSALKEKAADAKIVLYGHTHISKTEYEDGVYYINPGSVSASREGKNSYAVVDITEGGIMPIIIEL